jgi:hypothetical protein
MLVLMIFKTSSALMGRRNMRIYLNWPTKSTSIFASRNSQTLGEKWFFEVTWQNRSMFENRRFWMRTSLWSLWLGMRCIKQCAFSRRAIFTLRLECLLDRAIEKYIVFLRDIKPINLVYKARTTTWNWISQMKATCEHSWCLQSAYLWL